MSEMVERVATAIRDACPIGDRMHIDVAHHMARAAIEAMREPTSEMIEAEPEDDGAFDVNNSVAHARAFWQAMIDAALTETYAVPVEGTM